MDTIPGLQVAIKVLPDIFTGHPERAGSFRAQGKKLLASLNHPNMPRSRGCRTLSRASQGELLNATDSHQRSTCGCFPCRALSLHTHVFTASTLVAAPRECVSARTRIPEARKYLTTYLPEYPKAPVEHGVLLSACLNVRVKPAHPALTLFGAVVARFDRTFGTEQRRRSRALISGKAYSQKHAVCATSSCARIHPRWGG